MTHAERPCREPACDVCACDYCLGVQRLFDYATGRMGPCPFCQQGVEAETPRREGAQEEA